MFVKWRLTPSLLGARGREFFIKSGLPPLILKEIWLLADVDSDGCLNEVEFSIAMHLVDLALQMTPPPASLPPPLAECVEVVMGCGLPPIEDKHLVKCQNAFVAFKADIARGTLGSEE